jgi:hypothetical protein
MPKSTADRIRLARSLGWEKGEKPVETFCTQPETRVEFFLFFARNPFEKAPNRTNKTKENQTIFFG